MPTKTEHSYDFIKSVLDSITDHIAVIDSSGFIQLVNRSWMNFGVQNSCAIRENWIGVNYLHECDGAAKNGDKIALKVQEGIRRVIEKEKDLFYFEYPCNSPDEERWFLMRVTPFCLEGQEYFVICHHNITERKIAEKKVLSLARIDTLTNIPNRRAFNEFLQNEWKRSARKKRTLSVAIIDIDHFKLVNDTYGHHVGDEALSKIGSLLKKITNRPGDLAARYGGEEFAIIWSDTNLDQAVRLATVLIEEIIALNIPNEKSPLNQYLTASIGVASVTPTTDIKEVTIIKKADKMLYKAKKNGRCRVEFQ